MARRGGLGKGLGALIPPGGTEGTATELGGLDELPLASITPNRFQPRGHFDEEALSQLAESIREVGVLQPVLVRPIGDGEYELIAGERRWRAARRVGLQTIPALVRETDDAAALEQALVENIHRDGLNPLEEAAAYQQLIEDFGLTHDEVASRVGRSRATVTNTLRLMQLPPAIQKSVQDGKLSNGHARALLGSPDPRQALCYQCHAPLAGGLVGSGDDRTPVGVHEGLSCLACHLKHGQQTRASCANCHPRLSNCGLDVEKMDTTFLSTASGHNIHFVKCADCHPKGIPHKRS